MGDLAQTLAALDVEEIKRALKLAAKLKRGESLTKTERARLKRYDSKASKAGGGATAHVAMTVGEAAQAFGVSARTVEKWRANGCPGEPGNYNLIEMARWREARDRPTESANGEGTDWQDRYREMKAKLAELELKLKLKELIPRDEVEREWFRRIDIAKAALLGLPRKMAPALFGLTIRKIDELLSAQIEEILKGFAGQNDNESKVEKSKVQSPRDQRGKERNERRKGTARLDRRSQRADERPPRRRGRMADERR